MDDVHSRHWSFVARAGLYKFDYHIFELNMIQSWASHIISTPQLEETLYHKLRNLEFLVVVLGHPIQQYTMASPLARQGLPNKLEKLDS
ncbi:hypothetical protein U1Q18_009381 [Sarracenia purpurea var. burkii]